MSNKLAVLINGEVVLEYDRDFTLSPQQLNSLDKMDEKMDSGIDFAGQHVESPDKNQRFQFVANNMLQSLMGDENEALIAASVAYLATRLPDLKQIKVNEENGQPLVDLVFDQEYKNQVRVSFPTLN